MKNFMFIIFLCLSVSCIAQSKDNNIKKIKEVKNESKTVINLKDEDKYIKSLLKPIGFINIKDRSDLVFVSFLENKVKWDEK
ncbi:TPA: hypothetical protein ACX6S8_000894 [Photobacterium damselae]|uniref:hypothetical protein n=1 Tax=Photobacterium damselae TaxID=38293 RepID=UPI001593B6FA|nr:hypothetical protein [Photobacterium damselae]NVH48443.1 hypothetical protein [Photobacterium damselae subsp. damselae]